MTVRITTLRKDVRVGIATFFKKSPEQLDKLVEKLHHDFAHSKYPDAWDNPRFMNGINDKKNIIGDNQCVINAQSNIADGYLDDFQKNLKKAHKLPSRQEAKKNVINLTKENKALQNSTMKWFSTNALPNLTLTLDDVNNLLSLLQQNLTKIKHHEMVY